MGDAVTSPTLVVAPSWVGDTVMALPTLEALAASGRRLAVLARPHLEPLLSLAPSVETVVERRDDGDTISRLAERAYEEAVLLPNSFHAAWIAWRAGIPRRWGYRGQLRSLLLSPGVSRGARGGLHQVEDYRPLLTAMGVPRPEGWTPSLALAPEERRRGRERLAAGGVEVSREGPLVGLFPGAEFGPSKRWPVERFARLSHSLRQRLPTSRQVLLAGPGEVWLGVRLHETSGKLHPVLGPELDLAGLAAVLAHLDVLVTNDSGPMHLAAALGVPCVALFGPTDPRRTRPVGDGHRVLYTGRWCSPCFRRRCPLLHHRCLRDIGVEEVAATTERVLQDGYRHP